jgi:UPF0271 protein
MRVDLNADVGETAALHDLGQDPALMRYVTSVNIACGFHAGSPHVMRRTVHLARQLGIAVGAHPGFPDVAGFGRRPMRLSADEIEDIITYQLGALSGIAAASGVTVTHVKPHGALYNLAAADAGCAAAIARATAAVDPNLILVGLADSHLVTAGREAGLRIASEVFADRGYDEDGRLLARSLDGAVIDDLDQVRRRAVWMVEHRAILTRSGSHLPCEVDTICIHGDTPGAPALAQAVRDALTAAGVTVAALKADV